MNQLLQVSRCFPKRLPVILSQRSRCVPLITCSSRQYNITMDTINPFLKEMEYAVRGPIVIRALEIENDLKRGVKKPFTEVIRCNIGDCHATGQPAITFLRQMVSLCVNPSLFDDPKIPDDVKMKARRFLDNCGGNSVGAYSNSTGVEVARSDVAKYIEKRDNIPTDSSNIYLTTGASEAVKAILQLLSTTKSGNEKAGIMVPIPQYPLYSATNAEYNAYQIDYFLDEDNNWGLKLEELERALGESKGKCFPKAIVVINPGNPTGQVLTRANIEMVLQFAAKHGLLVMADEVYQHNIYAADREFLSFKRVMHEMGGDVAKLELVSFMSSSKGYMGECGFRGGYGELVNFSPDVKAILFKALSAKLCSSVTGQAMMDAVVNPPQPGEPSYDLFIKEKTKVLDDLKVKAKMATETFNSIPGFKCNVVQGAMYAFPQFQIPPKAIEEAKAKKMSPDFMYCLQFLEETGVCVVPGSGFGQNPGTFHFRITILPPVEKMKIVMEKIKEFHAKFLKKYS